MNDQQLAQAYTEWTSIEDAQKAVFAAVEALARAQYQHNLTRGCDPLQAYRVVCRDLEDTLTPASNAARTAVQAEVVKARKG